MLHKLVIGIPIAILIGIGIMMLSGCHRHFGHCFLQKSHEKKVDWMFKKVAKELKLDKEQKGKLTQIKDEILTKKHEFKSTREEMFEVIISQVKNDRIDQEVLNRLFDSKKEEMTEMRSFIIAKFAEFHSILTQEQKNMLYEKMTKCHAKQR